MATQFSIFGDDKKVTKPKGNVEDSPIKYGDKVQVTETSADLKEGSLSVKYNAGEVGFIIGVKALDGGEYEYLVQTTGMIPLTVPGEHLEVLKRNVHEQVQKRLDEKQVSKKFKDVGARVGGSKKEKRAYTLITAGDLNDIELDEATAIQLITKDKVYAEVNVAEQRAAGVSAGAAYLKVKIREACGSKPPNDKKKRSSFVRFIEELVKELEPIKTVDGILEYLNTWNKIPAWKLLSLFFEFPELTEEQKENAEVRFKQAFTYQTTGRVFEKVIEEIFGKRFSNFISFSSDPSKIVRQEAKDFEVVTAEQEKLNREIFRERKQRFIDANNANIELYKAYTHEELKSKLGTDWRGMDQYRRDMEGFRKAVIDFYNRRIDKGKREMELFPDNLKEHEDNWSWFEEKKDKKTVEKSGELQINTWTPLSYIKRTGGYVIKKEYVEQSQNTNPDENPITRDFGFKSAQFGNALKDVEARQHVRHFLGAIVDLAEMLDMDIKELNGIGGLSIAFAARGSRGASAHYERGHTIINITNRSGDGAIAHEWSHYLDNAMTIFGKSAVSLDMASDIKKIPSRYNRNSYSIESFVSNQRVTDMMVALMDFIEHGKPGITPDVSVRYYPVKIGDIFYVGKKQYEQKKIPTFFDEKERKYVPVELKETIQETIANINTRASILKVKDYRFPEIQIQVMGYIIASFDLPFYELMFQSGNQSAYYYYSSRMSSQYWIRPTELFARAWECYIFDKLQQKGRMNNYLVSGEYFQAKVRTKDGGETYIYPFGEERKHLFGLFENLVRIIKEEFKISSFKPFTDVREDEYLALDGSKESGVEVEGKFEEGGSVDYYDQELSFELGTPAVYHSKGYEGRIMEEAGEIVMNKENYTTPGGAVLRPRSIKGISLYPDKNYAGHEERFIVPNWFNVETFYQASQRKQKGKKFVLKEHPYLREGYYEEGGQTGPPAKIEITSYDRGTHIYVTVIDDWGGMKVGEIKFGSGKVNGKENTRYVSEINWEEGEAPGNEDDVISVIDNNISKISTLPEGQLLELSTSKELTDSNYVELWGRFNLDSKWIAERTNTISEIKEFFGFKPIEGESIHKFGRDYAWFAMGVDPNREKQKRLDLIYYQGMVTMLSDIKKNHGYDKDYYTKESFDSWWDRTHISDESRIAVKMMLVENGLLK